MKLSGPNAGQVTNVLHPIGGEWEEGYSRPSTGSLILAARDPSQVDVWPDTGIYISQVMPDGSRRCRFGGYFPANGGNGGGALTVGMVSIDTALNKCLFAGPDDPYTLIGVGVPGPSTDIFYLVGKPTGMEVRTDFYSSANYPATQASLPAFLVKVAAKGNLEGEGSTRVPLLDSVVDQPYTEWDGLPPVPAFMLPFQNWWDFKNIGQWVAEMVGAEDGVKYWIEHIYTNGYWSSVMHFSDQIGTDRDYTLRSDRDLWQYGLEVDGTQRASRVYGVGAGEEWNTQFSIAYDAGRDTDYPEWQATQAWKDQTGTTLDGLTRGVVADHRDPTTIPSGTVVGLPDYDSDAAGFDPQKGFPAPEICVPGDTFGVDIGYGAITVKDIRVRNLGVAWSLKEGAPVERTIAMQPLERPSLSVRTQTPTKPPDAELPVTQTPTVTADPWPQRGKLTNVTNDALTEISGMEASVQNPGHVWVTDDEALTSHQVHLVSLKDGHTAATFTPNPGVSASPVGDPEAIRLSRLTGKLVLADTGDNALNRPTSGANQPHLLSVTEPKGAGSKGQVAAAKYPIAYPNGERINCETLLIHPTTDVVYLVSKETTRARVFSYGPLSAMSTANNVGTLVATLAIKNVSDGTHTYKGNFILLLNGTTKALVLKSDFSYAGAQLTIPAMTKPEAIAVRDSCSFVVTTEGTNAPIYQELIPTSFGATCTTPAGSSGTGGTTPTNPNATVPGQLIPMNNWKLQLPI